MKGAGKAGQVAGVEMEVRGGIDLPANLNSHGAVSFVLQQEPGKLKIKDLKGFIANRQAFEKQQQELAGSVTKRGALDLLDDHRVPTQLKEFLFQQDLRAHADFERQKGLKFCVAVGEDLMTEDEIRGVLDSRAALEGEQAVARRLEGRERSEPSHGEGRATFRVGEDLLNGYVPTWDPYKQDTWRMRADVLARLVRAVRRVIYRRRAQIRLEKLQTTIREAGGTKEGVVAVVSGERYLSLPGLSGSRGPRPKGPPPDRWRVQNHPFPTRCDNNFRTWAPMTVREPAPFEAVERATLVEPCRYHVMGYKREVFSPISNYVPLMNAQPLLTGAEEDDPLPGPCHVAEGDGLRPLPDIVSQRAPLTYPTDMVSREATFVPLLPSWGMDTSRPLPLREYPYHDSPAAEPSGSNTWQAMIGSQSLANIHLPRREPWLLVEMLPTAPPPPSPTAPPPPSSSLPSHSSPSGPTDAERTRTSGSNQDAPSRGTRRKTKEGQKGQRGGKGQGSEIPWPRAAGGRVRIPDRMEGPVDEDRMSDSGSEDDDNEADKGGTSNQRGGKESPPEGGGIHESKGPRAAMAVPRPKDLSPEWVARNFHLPNGEDGSERKGGGEGMGGGGGGEGGVRVASVRRVLVEGGRSGGVGDQSGKGNGGGHSRLGDRRVLPLRSKWETGDDIRYRLPRQGRVEEVEGHALRERQVTLASVGERLKGFNRLLKDPRLKLQEL